MKRAIQSLTLYVCLLAPVCAHAQTITITSFGAKSDGSNPSATTAAFRKVFASYPSAKIIIPAGQYAIDNSLGSLYVPDFSGEMEFQGDAQLVFQSPVHGGLRFVGGNGARIHGMHGTYASVPTIRTEEEFSFTSMNDLTVTDSIAQYSPGMGFLFTLCVRPKASNITVSYALADGVAFANSQNAQIVNYTAENLWDNGLAFYNYNYLNDWNGGTATNLHVSQVNGAHGIAIAGTSNVIVSDFVIEGTHGDGIWVSVDPVYATRYATNITIQHGVIRDPATIQPTSPPKFGIEFTNADNVLFSDIQITGSQDRAVSGTSPTGTIRFHNIRASNNLASDAFVIGSTGFVEIADCVSENSPNNGFSFDAVKLLIARDLKVVNSSSRNALNRAIWFGNGGSLIASNLSVIDDRGVPAGFVVGVSDSGPGATQTGSIQGISSSISNGALVVNKYSPGVKFSSIQ